MSKQHYRDSVGVIAAWAADEDMLGHSRLVSRYLAQQQRAGHLNGGARARSSWRNSRSFFASSATCAEQARTSRAGPPPDRQPCRLLGHDRARCRVTWALRAAALTAASRRAR